MRLNALFQALKMFMPGPVSENQISELEDHFSSNFSDRFVAQVKELKNVYALLNSGERGDFWARVDAPVKVGEYLLLRFKNFQDGKPCYKIIKRSQKQVKLRQGESISFMRLLFEEQELLVPIKIENSSYPEEKIEKDSSDKKAARAVHSFRLDFVVKTANLGLMIIQLQKKERFYYGQLLVESEKTGIILEKELGEFQTLLKDLEERNIVFLKWALIPDWLKEEISRNLWETGFRLDTQV